MPTRRQAFTLVELLVVIAIIGVLVSLLLPAVNSAREAARRIQCKNQIRQIALAGIIHEETHGFYPSGGWGKEWTGDPDRGFGKTQPGSWAFSILPFIEEQATFDLTRGLAVNTVPHRQAMQQLHTSSYGGFNCPSRRQSGPRPGDWRAVYNGITLPVLSQREGVVKGDYAANGGSGVWSAGDWPDFNIPTLSQADNPDFEWTRVLSAPDDRNPLLIWCNGLSHYRSEVKIRHIKDGLSKTYFIGEKHVDPEEYDGFAGNDWGENQSLFTGFEWDNTRLVHFSGEQDRYRPTRDTPNYSGHFAFGSAHAAGMNMSLCDGAVATVTYGIDREVHRRLGARNDELPVSLP